MCSLCLYTLDGPRVKHALPSSPCNAPSFLFLFSQVTRSPQLDGCIEHYLHGLAEDHNTSIVARVEGLNLVLWKRLFRQRLEGVVVHPLLDGALGRAATATAAVLASGRMIIQYRAYNIYSL